jgi:hypothetical protein
MSWLVEVWPPTQNTSGLPTWTFSDAAPNGVASEFEIETAPSGNCIQAHFVVSVGALSYGTYGSVIAAFKKENNVKITIDAVPVFWGFVQAPVNAFGREFQTIQCLGMYKRLERSWADETPWRNVTDLVNIFDDPTRGLRTRLHPSIRYSGVLIQAGLGALARYDTGIQRPSDILDDLKKRSALTDLDYGVNASGIFFFRQTTGTQTVAYSNSFAPNGTSEGPDTVTEVVLTLGMSDPSSGLGQTYRQERQYKYVKQSASHATYGLTMTKPVQAHAVAIAPAATGAFGVPTRAEAISIDPVEGQIGQYPVAGSSPVLLGALSANTTDGDSSTFDSFTPVASGYNVLLVNAVAPVGYYCIGVQYEVECEGRWFLKARTRHGLTESTKTVRFSEIGRVTNGAPGSTRRYSGFTRLCAENTIVSAPSSDVLATLYFEWDIAATPTDAIRIYEFKLVCIEQAPLSQVCDALMHDPIEYALEPTFNTVFPVVAKSVTVTGTPDGSITLPLQSIIIRASADETETVWKVGTINRDAELNALLAKIEGRVTNGVITAQTSAGRR